MRNAPYIHPSHDSIFKLWQTFPNVARHWKTKFPMISSRRLLRVLVVDGCRFGAMEKILSICGVEVLVLANLV